jgi:ABC-type Fe3+-hydroxamate transport system, periplasmic component
MKNKNLIFILLLVFAVMTGCTSPANNSQTIEEIAEATEPEVQEAATEREITDMAGRIITIPAEIDMVFSCNPISAIYLYTLVPDQLLGWNYELNDVEKSIILEKYHSLPDFGMGDSINYETVIAANPTIALNVSTIREGSVQEADELQEKLGIPVIVVDSNLESVANAYRFLGELFVVEAQAEQLASYAENTFNDIANMDISEEEKVTIYYGNGEDSLETAVSGSSHGAIVEMVNARNIADMELGDGSRVSISAEQLLAWNPDVIIVNGEPKMNISGNFAAENLLNNPDFKTLNAVENGMVFGTPNAPFSWVDRPPGPNRIIGMRWLAKIIYPEYLDYDLNEEVRQFFELFYHVELSDEQLHELIGAF